mgnify:FL=1
MDKKFDRIYYNGVIRTMDEQRNVCSAIGIRDGKIAFLGNDEQAASLMAAEKTDLKGSIMLPGLTDSHLHMLNYAFVKQSYHMTGATSIAEIISHGCQIADEMKGEDHENWIYGRGWNEDNFTDEKRALNRFDLDKISTERPILFIRVCGHKAAVNTKGLEMVLGLKQTADYIDQIDQENGILTEASIKLCYDAMNEPTVENIKEMILFAQKDINARGITGVDSDNFLSLPGRKSAGIIKAYKELEKEGKLTLRVREQASFTAFEHMKAFIDAGYRSNDGGDYYKIGPVKLYQDGSLGARTALMNKPYVGTDDEYGIAVHDREDLENFVDYAYKNDMQMLIHAIGDKASDMICDAYIKAIEKYGRRDSRAINHLQIVSNDLFDRMKEYGIMAFIQPVFVASDMDIVENIIGKEATDRSYMWKTMMDKGLVCCGGSDAPVENFDVLENIQIAVTRDKLGQVTEGWYPEQKLSVDEAVRLFTIGNAYEAFEEDIRGTLEIGKNADMTVLDRDIFEIEPHEISKVSVLKTIVGGREVYVK